MSADQSGQTPEPEAPMIPGFAVTSVSPDDQTCLCAAMLIALLAHTGANVAAMVPVETGIDDPCEPGSRGALVRWAAGHLDNPRLVTPFALEADRPAMHAADASGTLLHSAAFDKARDELCESRTMLVVSDAVGLLDPITPSLTMLDLVARWRLSAVIVEPVSRWAVGHVRLLSRILQERQVVVAGVLLAPQAKEDETDDATVTAMQETLVVGLECPVLRLPRVTSVHDRGELLLAAEACGLQRIARRAAP
jgi:dethiobiotin synthetase